MPLIPPRQRPRRHGYGYGRRGHGRRSGGFGMWGPFPTYSRRTRSGGRISVGGCCLPIPLAFAVASGFLAGAARHGRHRR